MNGTIVSSTTDAPEVVQAIASGNEVRTIETELQTETSDDGRVTAASYEREDSSRNRLLQELEAAERQADEELAQLESLTDESAEAEAEEETTKAPEAEAENPATIDPFHIERPEHQPLADGLRALEQESPGLGLAAMSALAYLPPAAREVLARHPQGAAVLRDFAMSPYAAQATANLGPQEQLAVLLHALELQKKQQASKPAQQSRERFAPIRPVTGSARSKPSLDDDSLDYQSWRKLRDAEEKKRIRR